MLHFIDLTVGTLTNFLYKFIIILDRVVLDFDEVTDVDGDSFEFNASLNLLLE